MIIVTVTEDSELVGTALVNDDALEVTMRTLQIAAKGVPDISIEAHAPDTVDDIVNALEGLATETEEDK